MAEVEWGGKAFLCDMTGVSNCLHKRCRHGPVMLHLCVTPLIFSVPILVSVYEVYQFLFKGLNPVLGHHFWVVEGSVLISVFEQVVPVLGDGPFEAAICTIDVHHIHVYWNCGVVPIQPASLHLCRGRW